MKVQYRDNIWAVYKLRIKKRLRNGNTICIIYFLNFALEKRQ